jgi:PTS system nitrogen regulatory IIA component
MQLTMREVVAMFKVSEGTVTRWIRQQGLPAQRVAGQFRFNRVEVLDWAVENRIPMETSSVEQPVDAAPCVNLAAALEAGGIHYKVAGADREAVLGAVVARLSLPEDFDRQLLLRLFLARETLGSTAVGDGIAIPHVRYPIVLHVPRPLVTLCFLKRPIAYRAPDGKPVRVLFAVISPTVAAHIQLLARLSHALHNPGFRASVVEAKPREVILREARRVELTGQAPEETRSRAA